MILRVVAEDLKLYVMRFFDEFLDINAGIAERLFRFAAAV